MKTMTLVDMQNISDDDLFGMLEMDSEKARGNIERALSEFERKYSQSTEAMLNELHAKGIDWGDITEPYMKEWLGLVHDLRKLNAEFPNGNS